MTSVTSAGSGTLSSSPSYRLLNAQISPLATALEMNSRSNCLLPTGLARSHSISICSFSAAVKDISNTWDSIAFRTSLVRCKRYRSGRRLARAKRQDGRSSAARLAHARRPIFARCRAQSIQANSVEYSAICLTTRCLRRGPRRPDRLAGAAGARGRRSPLSPAADQQKTQQFLAIGAKLCSSFVLTILAKENAARARLSRNRSANRALRPSTDLRAARPLEIRAGATHRRCSQPRRVARRDRGAGRVRREADARHHLRPPGLGSGARPMPHPAEPFAAIQVGRLNEAPLVAFAMTGATSRRPTGWRQSSASSTAIMGLLSPPSAAAPSRRVPGRPPEGPRPMAGRCSAAPSLRRETVERFDGRPRHDLILRSPRSGRLEGRSRRRRRARWSLLRDLTPAAPLLRTRRQGRTAATLSVTVARKFRRKPLKKLIPRPAFQRPPKPSAARMRRDRGPARPPLTRSGETRRRPTITGKSGANP